MANTKVTGDVIANGTISTVHLADDAITAAKLDSTATGITFADLTVDTDTLYVDAANNRVGIGTTSPSSRLHIYSSDAGLRVVGTTRSQILLENSTSTWQIESPTSTGNVPAGALGIIEAGVGTRLSILTGGNVGIGTTSPAYKLDVNGSINTNNFIRTSNTTSGLITDTITALNTGLKLNSNLSTRPITFEIDSNEKMRVHTNGNVGIGTTSPSATLNIKSLNSLNSDSLSDVITKSEFKLQYRADDLSSMYLGGLGSERGYLQSINNAENAGTSFSLNPYGGNVGIGTTSPGYTFTVFKSITNDWLALFGNTYNGAGNGVLIDAGDGSSGEILRLRDKEGNSKVSFLSNGNVGIGTTSPGTKLHIDGGDLRVRDSGNVAIQIVSSNSGQSAIQFGDDGDTNDGRIVYMNATDLMRFFTNDSEKMVIDSSGNVGIGTDSPDFRLGLSNSTALTPVYQQFTNGTTGTASGDGTVMGIDSDGDFLINNQEAKEIKLYTNDTQRLTIDSSGNVGITASASLRFNTTTDSTHAVGYDSTVDGSFLRGQNGVRFITGTGGGTERMRIRSDGYIQQGIAGTSTNAYYFFDTINYGDSGIIFRDNISTNSGYLTYNHGQDAMKFAAGGSERMRIDSSGSVGIGTTSPSYKLDVNGTLRMTSSYHQNVNFTNTPTFQIGTDTYSSGFFVYDSTAAQYRMVVKSSTGNVGIGTTSPQRKLDVAGEITHEGLVPKAGAFVDGLVTINKTVSISANTWTSLDISLSNIGGSGTFAVQVYSDAHGSTGGAWYSMYWSGIMSWFHTSTNDDDIDEIPLHMAGHARNNNTLELRTKLHTADGSSYANRCELQIKTANALSSAPISFRFRKLL